MIDQKLYNLAEVEALSGGVLKESALRKRINRNKLSAIVQYVKNKPKNFITEATLQNLLAEIGDQENHYQKMIELYEMEMRSSSSELYCNRPLSDDHINQMLRCLERVWEITGKKASIEEFNVKTYRQVVDSFEVDLEKQVDRHGTKKRFFVAFTGLMKLLEREGYKTKAELDALYKLAPSKSVTLKKKALSPAEVLEVFEKNSSRTRYRRKYDVQSFNILVALYAYAGLRKMEAAILTMDRIHLEHGYILVYGKNKKERIVPIFPELHEKLIAWFEFRAKFLARESIVTSLVVPQYTGLPHTKTSLQTRFQRFCDIPDNPKVTPHFLRYSCATIAANHGMPPALIQEMLGHSSIRTTQGYILLTASNLLDWVKQRGSLFTVAKQDSKVTQNDIKVTQNDINIVPMQSANTEFQWSY